MIYIPDRHVTLPHHGAIHASYLDAFDPLQRIIDMARARIGPMAQRQAPPFMNPVGVEVDLPPQRLLRRDVIAEGDVAAIADEVDIPRRRKHRIDDRQDEAGLAELPTPSAMPLRIV